MDLPYITFWKSDWMSDPLLTSCSLATRGAWMDILCAIHSLDNYGKITRTLEQFAKLARCTPQEMRSAIDELKEMEVADITEIESKITIISRRMKKDQELRDKRADAGREGGLAKGKQKVSKRLAKQVA